MSVLFKYSFFFFGKLSKGISHLDQYGYDDENLYERLQAAGIRRLPLDLQFLFHRAHSDQIRIRKVFLSFLVI
jgi:hypothetical protein